MQTARPNPTREFSVGAERKASLKRIHDAVDYDRLSNHETIQGTDRLFCKYPRRMAMNPEQVAKHLVGLRRVTSAEESLNDLLEAAVRYAGLRVEWYLRDREGRLELEATRTAAHEVLIGCCNALSRAMVRVGEDNQWRASLGDNRKAIGDLACHLHCLLGLAAG